MNTEFRIMLFSEKSGKKYSVKIRLLPLNIILLALISTISYSVIAGYNLVEALRLNKELSGEVTLLEKTLERLKEENKEAALYKKWSDAIIYRRFNYEEKSLENAKLKHPREGEFHDTSQQTTGQSAVDIDDFDVRRINLDLDFEVSFNLVKRSRGNNKFSGYLYIIALNTEVKPEMYTSWPKDEMLSGLPKNYKKGNSFSIRYLKKIKGRINQPAIGPRYNRVDIICYAEDGKIVLKKGFYIERFLEENPYG